MKHSPLNIPHTQKKEKNIPIMIIDQYWWNCWQNLQFIHWIFITLCLLLYVL